MQMAAGGMMGGSRGPSVVALRQYGRPPITHEWANLKRAKDCLTSVTAGVPVLPQPVLPDPGGATDTYVLTPI
ncbi:hypothetical protein BaRGS_00016310 [Batillaria attramentaria]|uniref:Uncharacterized protein n=1 Tax=Batillaria attramentaria TaxID=370345 RepID=A0ABD0KYY9_9CAEN